MPDNLIEQAMELATSDRAAEAIEVLWPLMRDEESRPKTLFTLAFCFERAGNYATAAHLYQKTLAAEPEHEIARERLAHVRTEAEARGVFEDFTDRGHVDCPCGALRQRAEYGACPYCGISRDGSDPLGPKLLDEAEESLPGWDDPTFGERLEDAAQLASAKIKVWMDREDVKEVTTRLGQVGEEMSQTAKHVAEHEKVKATADRVQKAANTASERVTEFLDSTAVRDAARKVRKFGHDIIEPPKREGSDDETPKKDLGARAKEFGQRTEKAFEDLTADPRIQHAQKRIRDTSEGVLNSLKGFLKRGKSKDDEDKDEE